MVNNKEKMYSVKEVADMMGLSRVAIFNYIKKGKLKAQKVGRNYVINSNDLSDITNRELSAGDKKAIERGVKRVLSEYGETIKLLGKE
ncbi:MAG: helix-turn-helix domain-containing protein [bacterium]|nr:helix-turn-helix domain-containing protein [bacterium]